MTDKRVADLLAQMTVDEKIAQLAGIWSTDLIDDNKHFSTAKAAHNLSNGIGHITRIGAAIQLPPQDSAALANSIQKYLIEQTRLGIPAIVHEESCAGYMALQGTTFPQAIGLAATWAPELIEAMTTVIRQQMRAVGAHHTLAPVVDVARDPRWGRIEETFGEDPYLISRIGVAYVKGIQGDDWTTGVVATGKHFLGYGWSEGGMNWAPAHIPAREMREIFATPFAAVIQEAHIGSIMNAYHEMDGVPVGSSKELMVDFLRGELDFAGVVVSDYNTLPCFVTYHHIAQNKAEAAMLGLQAGIDVELPTHDCYGAPLRQALEAGMVSIELVDQSVGRLLKMKLDLGLFDNPYVDDGKVIEVYNTPEQLALSRQLAQQSIVLLKNEANLLPLDTNTKTIAVIGPSANSVRLLQGDYHYPSHLHMDTPSESRTDAPAPMGYVTPVDTNEHFPPTTTVLNGIIETASGEVLYAQGCEVTGEDKSGFDAAIEIATKADVAVVVVGGKSGLSNDCTSGESLDRASLGLPGVQQALVEAIAATGTPTVVVLINGRPLALPWIAEHIPAILEAWLPAQEGGHAVADVLFGKISPGGKLPVSVPRDVGQVPVYYNHKPSGGRSHWQGEYIDMSTKPLYPFGHGLSYTTFEYSNLIIGATQVTAQDTVAISVDVKNTGSTAADEVVQLYLHDPVASVTRPVKELKGFKRLTLQPGERKTITFQVPVGIMAFYDRQMQFIVEPGEIEVLIGSSSADIRLQDRFEITGVPTPVKQVFKTEVEVK